MGIVSEIHDLEQEISRYENYISELEATSETVRREYEIIDAEVSIQNRNYDKTAHDDGFKNGEYKLPFKYEEFDRYGGRATLNYLSDVGIYNKETNTIRINNPDNLTEDEKTAILVITTGDRDKYAFAAENQFHASYYKNLPGRESHAIKSDAGIGESKGLPYEILFKSPAGALYQQQMKVHGGDK